MRKSFPAAAMFAAAMFVLPAAAQDLPAIEKIERSLTEVWSKAPLGFRKALFVEGDAGGFGLYTPRADSVFRVGAPILVYAEPYGYAWKDNGDGTFAFGFDCDVRLRDKTGKVLFEKPDFGKFRFASRVRNREIMLKLSLDLNEAPAGDFVLEYLVRDAYSDKSALISLPFAIAR